MSPMKYRWVLPSETLFCSTDSSSTVSDNCIHKIRNDSKTRVLSPVAQSVEEKKTNEDDWERGPYDDTTDFESPPWYTAIGVLFSYAVLITLSTFADWLRARGFIKVKGAHELDKQKDFAPLNNQFEALYVNNLYRIACDVVNRPLAGFPGAVMKLRDRVTHNHGWNFEYTGIISDVINMGSYNYLGFARNDGPCAEAAARHIDKFGIGICSTRHEFGSSTLQGELDRCVADYLGVEDAVCFPMGFGTNSMNISAFVGKGCLILSDELNHASLVLGSRLSGAEIKVFKHNNAADLEKKLIKALANGQSGSGEPYKKVLIIIEGIYSMEGTIVNLPAFVKVKKRYKAYLFLDEAHSVGALGPTGRGVVEYWGCDPNDIDIMMGTLTKSFAAAGGYIGGRKSTIDYLRAYSQGACYGTVMSPPVIAQVTTSLKIMTGEDGTNLGREKTRQLSRNTRYLRRRLKQLGFLIYGHDDSPVVPIMTFFLTKVVCFGRETLKHNLGVVSVGYPATPLTKSRARLCVSADHTKEHLDQALEIMDEIGDLTRTKYGRADTSGVIIEY